MIFGLACEGVTDQIILQNILCGYFENPDLDEEINQLQPLLDETDKKQKNFGGWQMLLAYLVSSRFHDDVLNNKYIIIQVDTDVSNETGFDVSQVNVDNQLLTVEDFIKNVIEKLIDIINGAKTDFYQQHSERIVFCISVHSIECWLFSYYNNKALKKPKITGCYKALSRLIQGLEKNYQSYDKISRIFLKKENIDTVSEKNPSFRFFIDALESLNVE
jgi:hypothetical protein